MYLTPRLSNSQLAELTTAVVFCGGKATRLEPFLKGSPKALLLISNKPYLLGLLVSIRLAGLRKVVLCISKYTLSIVDQVASYGDLGLIVEYSIDSGEEETAGALFKAYKMLHTPLILCIHGDVIVDVNYSSLLQFHLHMDAVATLVVSERLDQPHVGGTEISLDGWVQDIHEAEQDTGSLITLSQYSLNLSNSGIYVLDRERFYERWIETQRIGKIEEGVLRTLAHKRVLAAYINGERFSLDVGTPERLKRAMETIDQIRKFFPID
jgi:NDP-sugar pyrophosphorylase family protein